MVYGGRGWSVDESVLMAKSYLHTFSSSRVMSISSFNEPKVIYKDKWTIFCDGSWCKLIANGGFVAAAMKEGCIFLCKVGLIDQCLLPGEGEMRGVLAGVELAKEFCATHVSFQIALMWSSS